MKLRYLLALIPFAAQAQPVNQAGRVTPGHAAQWETNGVVKDAGTATNGTLTNLGLVGPGVPLCINDAPIASAGGYHQLCLGANALGGGLLSYNAYGGAAPLPLNFNINGATTPSVGPYLPLAGGTIAGTLAVTGKTFANGGLVVTGPNVVTNNFPGLIHENFAVSGTSTDSPVVLNILQSQADTVNATGHSVNLLYLSLGTGGASAHGDRAGIVINDFLNATTGNTGGVGGSYAGIVSTMASGVNDNGTGLTGSTARGIIFGANMVGGLGGTATNYQGVTAQESDVYIASGASALDKIGMSIVELSVDAHHGSRTDAAFVLANQAMIGSGAPGWSVGFELGSAGGYWPFAATGSIMTAVANVTGDSPLTVTNGFYLPNVTFTGFELSFPGFTMDGSGNAIVRSITTSVLSSGTPATYACFTAGGLLVSSASPC